MGQNEMYLYSLIKDTSSIHLHSPYYDYKGYVEGPAGGEFNDILQPRRPVTDEIGHRIKHIVLIGTVQTEWAAALGRQDPARLR